MMRAMILGAASALALATGPVMAQQAQPGGQAPAGQAATGGPPASMVMGPFMELDDMNVYAAGGDRVGEIDDVVIDAQGNIAFVVEIEEGFLGLAEKDVLIPMDRLILQGDRFQSRMTEDELKALREWD